MRCMTALSFTVGLLTFTACQKRESPVAEGNRTQTLLIGNLSEPNDLDPPIPTASRRSTSSSP